MSSLGRVNPVAATYVPGLRREISPVHDVRAFVSLLTAFRSQRPGIVHTHMSKAGLLGRLAAYLSRTPVILHTFHGNVLSGYFNDFLSTSALALERGLAGISTRVISISRSQTAELVRLRVARHEKIVELPLGLDLRPFFAPQAGGLSDELGIPSEVPLVGIVARLVPIKRVDVFIRAAAQLQGRGRLAHFVIVGDGPQRPRLEALAEALGLTARSHFLGWRADLSRIYSQLDVVALTSRNEGFPVALIEALAAGRAVVASAVGGVPDLVMHDRTGLLVPAEDVGATARAIERLLEDPALRAAFGEAGRASVYPRYDAATLVERITRLYEDLIASQS